MSLEMMEAVRKARQKAEQKQHGQVEKESQPVESKEEPVTETPVEPTEEVVEEASFDEWQAKYQALEQKMLRQQEAYDRQIASARKNAADQSLASRTSIEKLNQEIEFWKKQVEARDEFDFDKDTFANRFKFAGNNIMFGSAWEEPLTNMGKTARRIDIQPFAFLSAFDIVHHLTGRQVTVDSSGYRVTIQPNNLILRGPNEEFSARGLSFFVMMAFGYQFDLDKLVQFGWYWVRAKHTELAAKPSAVRELVQGDDKLGSKAYDFYLLALAYRDLCKERRKHELSENELMTQLYDLRDRMEKHMDLSRDIQRRVLTDELLTSLLVGRELGIHNHPLRSGLLPKDLKEYLASRVPDTEVEIARTVMHEAQSYAEEVARRDTKAGK